MTVSSSRPRPSTEAAPTPLGRLRGRGSGPPRRRGRGGSGARSARARRGPSLALLLAGVGLGFSAPAAGAAPASAPGPVLGIAPVVGAAPAPTLTATRTLGLPPGLDADLERIDRRRLDIQRGGMITLGAWALGNVGVGLAGDLGGDGDDPTKYFHQMNWMWGAVNGVIAGFGIAGAFTEDPRGRDYLESVELTRTVELVYLFNGALDLSYMAVGAWLWERGLRTQEPVLEGYGQSLVMQGGFLLLFDGVMFVLTHTVSDELGDLPIQLVPMGQGAAVVGRF